MTADTPPRTGSEPSPLKRAFAALQQAEAKLAAVKAAAREPIAVVGLGCRVPGGGTDAASFWRLLQEGVDAVGPVPEDRWNHDRYFDPDPGVPGHIATNRGGFLDGVDQFDPGAFGIAPREAQGMDPQQRLLLEVCWEALEHAAVAPDSLSETATGLFVGAAASDYAYLQLKTGDDSLLDAHFASGIAHSTMSGRVSYLLGLQGPSITLDTACSSSLVSVHLACQALRTGDCNMALAGGVNLILGPDIFVALSQARMLAPDGRCKAFGAGADGFGRAEGCGIVVLKRLSDAQADGDRILAQIRGSAVNQDGASSGLTAPNGPAQESVIRAALNNAGLTPASVGLIEAHGTGTSLGDPVEAHALGSVFGDGTRSAPLALGSVKSNLGHLEAASGVTGLIKLVLSLHHKRIPRSLHCDAPSPFIDWDRLPITVATTDADFPEIDGTRVAGVSSFGFSGTNAHVLLEQAPQIADKTQAPRTPQILALSSRGSDRTLNDLALRHASGLEDANQDQFANICRTANAGRAHLDHRATVIAATPQDCARLLKGLATGGEMPGLNRARLTRQDAPRIAFLFTGQGAQYTGMGQGLYDSEPVFRGVLNGCAAILDNRLEVPLLDVMFGRTNDPTLINQTAYAQPALFALEYALSRLWHSWGIDPDIVAGHSLGEFVAAVTAGVFSLEDALFLVAERGRLMQSLPSGGAMASIAAPEDIVAETLNKQSEPVVIAGANSASQTVISGPSVAVEHLCATFTQAGISSQPLTVSHAFHSPLVEPVLDQFEHAVAQVKMHQPRLRLISNVTGQRAGPEIATSGYWRKHMRQAVRFRDSMDTLDAMAPGLVLELGPQATLLPLAAQSNSDTATVMAGTLRKGRDDRETLLGALSTAYLSGAQVNWRAVADPDADITDAPSYPFQRSRYWFSARSGGASHGDPTGHPLLGDRLRLAARGQQVFEAHVSPPDYDFIADHVVQGACIAPGAMFIEMALATAQQLGDTPMSVSDLLLVEPMRFAPDETRVIQTTVLTQDGDSAFEIASSPVDGDAWTLHVKGRFDTTPADPADIAAPASGTQTQRLQISGAEHYAALHARGLVFGNSLRLLDSIETIRPTEGANGAVQATGTLDSITTPDHFVLGPAGLDACLQVIAGALPADFPDDSAFLPFSIERVELLRTPGTGLTASVLTRQSGSGVEASLNADLVLRDDAGLVGKLTGILLRPARIKPVQALFGIDWTARAHSGTGLPPHTLAQSIEPLLEPLAAETHLADYDDATPQIDTLACNWIVWALRTMGWAPQTGQEFSTEALAETLGIAPHLTGQLHRYLSILAEESLLTPLNARDWQVVALPEPSNPTARTQQAIADYPASQARLTLMASCGPNLPAILTGERNPVEDLFPEGDISVARSLYRDTPEAQTFNRLVADTVAALAAHHPADRPLRILEVGAGSGGTTAWVLSQLKDRKLQYAFTDIGAALVAHARDEFGSYPFIDFATLDLEHDPLDQGFEADSFDVIIGANSIHATADLSATLGRLGTLLAPGGTLLMLEITGRERWVDLTFGLTEGWWLFSDTDWRRDYPLLTTGNWLKLLQSCGFEAASLTQEHAHSSQVLIAARQAPEATPVHWLIANDNLGVAAHLVEMAREKGDTSEVIDDIETHVFSPLSADRRAVLLDLGALQQNASADPDLNALERLRGTIRALAETPFDGRPPEITVVTRQAQTVSAGDLPNPGQAAVWGMTRALAEELPEFDPLLLDMEADMEASEIAQSVLTFAGEPQSERQIAIRNGTAFLPRLTGLSASTEQAPNRRLLKGASGVLQDVALVDCDRRSPGPGEVELRVTAAGLNLRDVMNALDMRDDPEPLGGECAGVVTAIGPDVSGFALGDKVLALAEAAFGEFAVARATEVAPLTGPMTPAEAATLPFAYMTALHALVTVGQIKTNEWVLIHAAAGGVGSAAIRIAQQSGARIIATVGSASKRDWLRSLGVEHVLSSRDPAFADDIRRITGGHGIDLALNSLSGDFIEATIDSLSPTGRFAEIGKRDIWTEDAFLKVRPDGQYHIVDIAALRARDPDAAAALFQQVVGQAGATGFAPLPHKTFPLAQASEAFQFMAQARHIGKVVLLPDAPQASIADALRPDASYMVTGGLRGLGLLAAQHLADLGARHLVLVGRTAPDTEAEAAITRMREQGVTVTVTPCDVSQADQVSALFKALAESHPPLRGILHAAGVLADGSVTQLDTDTFAKPLGPKVTGSWLLHQQTLDCPLDFFILYSSLAGVFGSAGQSNHAAANAYMDSLAHYRRALGLPATSLGWGAWTGVGIAAEQSVDVSARSKGIDSIRADAGLDLLDQALQTGHAHVVVSPFQWPEFAASRKGRILTPVIHDWVKSAETVAETPAAEPAAAVSSDLSASLAAAPAAKHPALIQSFVTDQVAITLGQSDADLLDLDRPLRELGLDSLMAVDLRNRLSKAFEAARGLPATLVFDHPTITALTDHLAGLFADHASPDKDAPPEPKTAPADPLQDIEALSDEEIDALIAVERGKTNE